MHRPPQHEMPAPYKAREYYVRAIAKLAKESYVPIEQHVRPAWVPSGETVVRFVDDRWWLLLGYDRRGWMLLAPMTSDEAAAMRPAAGEIGETA